MLLPRWHNTLARHGDAIAIHDGGKGVRFAELDAALGRLPTARAPVIATGAPREILLATLRGWRDRQPVVPVERADAALPDLGLITDAPNTHRAGGVAHIKPTPGNDGRPRGVWFTAGQIAADADRIAAAMGLDPRIPNLATVSLTHSYGYSSIILPLLLHGIPLQVVEVPFPAALEAAWRPHQQVVVPAVPSMWRAWFRSGILAQAPIALAVSAGAPLALDLEAAVWESHRLKIHNFYGASECGGISFDASTLPRSSAADLGSPLPGVEVTLSEDGRFLVRSDSVAVAYDQPRPGEVLGASTFLTADHGRLEAGRLMMDTRGGDHINVAGRKLGPGRIEAALKATGLVDRIRVFGIPSHDPERVEEVAALVPQGTDSLSLRRAAAAALAPWEIPRHWFESRAEAEFLASRQELSSRHRPL